MKIAAFFDGRRGHEKQTIGILDRLREMIAVDVLPVQVRRRNGALQFLQYLQLLCAPGASLAEEVSECDLLIGTGTPTHLPMLLLKKKHDIPVVTCMTPAFFLQNRFDLIFSPLHDAASGKNMFVTVGPPNPNIDKKEHRHDRVLVLCGGKDAKSHRWNSQAIISAIEAVIRRDSGKYFILSSSPRTPAEMVQGMARLAEKHPSLEFFDYRDTPPGWVEKEYDLCRLVWVTGDSISMVYEALSAGCTVGVIPVHWRRRNSKFRRSETYLHDSGLIFGLADYLQGHVPDQRKRQSLNEARRCAEEIIKRFA